MKADRSPPGRAARPASRPPSVLPLLLGSLLLAAACQTAPDTPPRVVRVYLEASPAVPGDDRPVAVLPESGSAIRLLERPVLGPGDFQRVETVRVDLGLAAAFVLTPAGARKLYRLTVDNLGNRLVFLDNGRPIGARAIDGPIRDGILYTFLEVPDAEVPARVAAYNETLALLRGDNGS